MDTFQTFIDEIPNPEHRQRFSEVLEHVSKTFPQLEKRFAWNQPMFTDHGTFIIAFSVAKKHMAFAPEWAGIQHFKERMAETGVDHSTMIIRMPWDKTFDYELLDDMIRYNLEDKVNCTSFWRAS